MHLTMCLILIRQQSAGEKLSADGKQLYEVVTCRSLKFMHDDDEVHMILFPFKLPLQQPWQGSL
jgi:hypothetical protein